MWNCCWLFTSSLSHLAYCCYYLIGSDIRWVIVLSSARLHSGLMGSQLLLLDIGLWVSRISKMCDPCHHKSLVILYPFFYMANIVMCQPVLVLPYSTHTSQGSYSPTKPHVAAWQSSMLLPCTCVIFILTNFLPTTVSLSRFALHLRYYKVSSLLPSEA